MYILYSSRQEQDSDGFHSGTASFAAVLFPNAMQICLHIHAFMGYTWVASMPSHESRECLV